MQRDTIIASIVAVAVVVVGILFFNLHSVFSVDLEQKAAEPIPTGSPTPTTSVRSVPFTELARGSQSKVTKRVNYLITSPAELGELWQLLGTNEKMPEIDFSTKSVAAVFAGQQPTGGYSIEIEKIEDGDIRKVTVLVTAPGSTCLVTQALMAPYQIVEMPKTALALAHENIATTTRCR